MKAMASNTYELSTKPSLPNVRRSKYQILTGTTTSLVIEHIGSKLRIMNHQKGEQAMELKLTNRASNFYKSD
jgi:hypothetical protein